MPSLREGSNLSDEVARQTTIYAHVSAYRWGQAELQLYSPSLKLRPNPLDDGGPLPVFGEHDTIAGKVTLDRSCYHTGRLFISVQGTLTYSSNHVDGHYMATNPQDLPKRQHTFFLASTGISVLPSAPPRSSSRTGFREAFIRRRPSVSSLEFATGPVASSGERSFPFEFELPHTYGAGDALPPSFMAGPSCESLEIQYKVKVIWEASLPSEMPLLWEVPILIYPDTDFHSADIHSSQEWLEVPLKSDRPIPFRSAITMPASMTFSRSSHVPYFVVFATTPRSPELAREIAADATVSVSLVRQVVVTEQASPPPTPPETPTGSGEESDSTRNKLFKRVRTGTPRKISRISRAPKILEDPTDIDKPLPQLPIHTVFKQSRTLESSICIGFPKRPRLKLTDDRSHPSLDSQNALPDGLHKSKIPLDKEMLPCIDWAGVSIKYYVDVSVLVGQDDLRARIPVKII